MKRTRKTENTGMRTFTVSIPIAGAISIGVEAESEEGAKDAAWEKYNNEGSDAGDVSWDAFEFITQGNVCHAPTNSVEVYEEGC